MAIVKPFKAILPSKDKVHLVASRSLDNYNKKQLFDKLQSNPFTFLHIIKPDYNPLEKIIQTDKKLLSKIKLKFYEFIEKSILIKEEKKAYYLYRQSTEIGSFTGIIALAHADDYFENIIKKHEDTLAKKEVTLKNYLEVCDFNAEPICMTYPKNEDLENIFHHVIFNDTPYFDFTTTDKIRHTVWQISDDERVKNIENLFAKEKSIYIADGHHRTASSALLAKEKKAKDKNYHPDKAYNYFLSFYLSDEQIKIFEFNRIIKDLENFNPEIFINQLKENFNIEYEGKNMVRPSMKGEFSMYMNEKWYLMNLKSSSEMIDAAILSKYVLDPILNITDLRNDKRIAFVSGKKGTQYLQEQVDSKKANLSFGLFPVEIADVFKMADKGENMPPKTTWIEPKMRSGLVIYSLETK
jgi:uncharacterized protein (DUF1015 family)